MQKQEQIGAIEAMLFVAGDPVPVLELQRVLDMTELELYALLQELQTQYRQECRGFQLSVTAETIQILSNSAYADYVERLLQPAQQKTFSQSLIETLAVVAYRQPATRADVEAVRGVRCEYAMAQLVKLNMIQPVGRKDAMGRPVLYGTTDAFLRQFGISTIAELPNHEAYSKGEAPIAKALTV